LRQTSIISMKRMKQPATKSLHKDSTCKVGSLTHSPTRTHAGPPTDCLGYAHGGEHSGHSLEQLPMIGQYRGPLALHRVVERPLQLALEPVAAPSAVASGVNEHSVEACVRGEGSVCVAAGRAPSGVALKHLRG
jgi:hypothetical protein